MSGLSQEQIEKRAAIQKTATIWGVIVGAIAGLLAVWLLGGQGGAVRWGGAIVVALVAGFLVHRASFNSGAKSARCPKCGAAFSRSRTDRTETVVASTDREEREEQPDGSTKLTTWVEDTLDVVDTYTCANCGDVTTETYQITRRRDETSVVQPPAASGDKAGGAGNKPAGKKTTAKAKPAQGGKDGGSSGDKG